MTETLEREATRVITEAPERVEIGPREPRGLQWIVALVLAAVVIAVGTLMYLDEYSAPILDTGDYVTTGVRYTPQPYAQVEPTLGL